MGEDRAMTATEAVKNSPLKNVMNGTDMDLDELHMAIDKLASKMTPLTSQSIEGSPEKDGAEPYPGSSEIVQRLSEQQLSIRRAAQFIRNITRGAEV